jgi:hypothetical protein
LFPSKNNAKKAPHNRKRKMMDVLGLGFSESKTKPYLKMASQRISIANNRKTNLIKQHKREVAKLLQEGKEEKARIRVPIRCLLWWIVFACRFEAARRSVVVANCSVPSVCRWSM